MAEPGFPVLCGEAPLDAAHYGLKAALLQRACAAGERVPEGFVIDAESALALARAEPQALERLARSLSALLAACPEPITLAVRASPNRSVPGALLSELSVRADPSSLRASLQRVLASREQASVAHHLAAAGQAMPEQPWLAVLVQRYMAPSHEDDLGAVLFTHDPATGERTVCGELARGGVPSVVSGRTRPQPLRQLAEPGAPGAQPVHDPALLAELVQLGDRLAARFDEPLELEVARVNGQVWLLQLRSLVLSPRALVRVAVDAIEDDSPTFARWLDQLASQGLAGLTETHLQEPVAEAPLLRGVAASMGAAAGVVVTDVERACERAQREPVVLVRPDAVPEDVAALRVAQAVVTTSGGLTCHAAVIARGLRVPAVVGCRDVRFDAARGAVVGGRDGAQLLLREGDWVSVDARRGLVYRGRLPLEQRVAERELHQLFAQIRKLRPTPLWVQGVLEPALRAKEELCLDGALCSWPEHGQLPAGRGRECWVELPAALASAQLPELPQGWGVVLTGEVLEGQVAALRKLSPLRALGLRVDSLAQLHSAPRERLDLLVLGPEAHQLIEAAGADAAGSGPIDAARVLKLLTFSAGPHVLPGHNVGWVCPVSDAAVCALRYASARARTAAWP